MPCTDRGSAPCTPPNQVPGGARHVRVSDHYTAHVAKTIDLTIPVPVRAGTVRLQLTSADGLQRVVYASGPNSASVSVDGDGRTTITRVFDAPPSTRGFLKSDTIEIVEERTWTQSGADISATVTGFPITITGKIDLKETGNNCVLHISATVEAKMGFANPLAEGMVKDRFIEVVQLEAGALH